ncbi:MAG: hypothetical protein Q9170_004036 [Blastenia crenularia]
MADTYAYTPLAEHEVRILTLLPGAFEDKIRIKLHSELLNESQRPAFQALSYTWGSASLVHDIVVDGDPDQTLPITENLHTALRYLRENAVPRVLWADAVCINQKDVEERNQQVKSMAKIYSLAEKVIVWLGPESHDSQLAMGALALLSSKIRVDWAHLNVTPAADVHGIEPEPDWLDQESSAPLSNDTYFALLTFLNRPWFGRLWIWQEVFMAADRAEIVCGRATLSWQAFRMAVLSLFKRRKPQQIRGLYPAISRAWQISNLYDRPSLKVIMRRTKNACCSDQRDRIFGVLQLLEEQNRCGIQPDYSKSVVEVFRELMVASVFEYWDLTLLTCCELGENPPGLPSWVPNWSRPRRCSEIWMPRACWNASLEVRSDETILTLSGRRIATITRVDQILTERSTVLDTGDRLPELRETYRSLRDLLMIIKDQLPINFDRSAEKLARTFCLNHFRDRYEPINTNHIDFQETITQFLTLSDDSIQISDSYLVDCVGLLDAFFSNTVGRAFITTEEGYFGIAPEQCRIGDSIAVLLNCQSPVLLRANDTSQYTVVGECYIHDFMDGEAFLGLLPRNWQRVARYDEATQISRDAFIDRENGLCQTEDPRLGPLPENWVVEDHPMQHLWARYRDLTRDFASIYDPRMRVSSLRDIGVSIEDFELV